MRRRQYLASFATLSTVAVAGCGGDEPDPDGDPGANGDDPPEDGTDDPDDTDDDTDDGNDDEPAETPTGIHEVSDVAEALGDTLADNGIDVDYLDVEGSWVVLEYYTDAEVPEDLDSDATTVALAYADHVDDFDEFENVEGMEGWALDNEGGLVGRFHIEAGWARAFADGDSTEDGYLAEVHGTIQA